MSDDRFADVTDEELEAALGSMLIGPAVDPPADAIARIREEAIARHGASGASGAAPTATAAATATNVTAIPAASERRSFPGPRFVLGAVAAVVVAFAIGTLIGGGFGDPVDDLADAGEVEFDGTMSGIAGDDAELLVVKTGIGREIALSTDALEILPTGAFYEVWFVAPDDNPDAPNRISAGTFHPDADGRSDVRFAAAVDPELFPTIEITSEPEDGDPRSSGVVLLEATIGS